MLSKKSLLVFSDRHDSQTIISATTVRDIRNSRVRGDGTPFLTTQPGAAAETEAALYNKQDEINYSPTGICRPKSVPCPSIRMEGPK